MTWEEEVAELRKLKRVDQEIERDERRRASRPVKAKPKTPAELLLEQSRETNRHLRSITFVCTVFLVALILSVVGSGWLFLMTLDALVE